MKIYAVQFKGNNYQEIAEFVNLEDKMRIITDDPKDGDLYILIPTIKGNAKCSPKDWVIKKNNEEIILSKWIY